MTADNMEIDNKIPRRNHIDKFTPAEQAIWQATHVVEMAGADVRLTDAVVLLGQAREKVADFVDGVTGEPVPQEAIEIVGIVDQGPSRQLMVTARVYGEQMQIFVPYENTDFMTKTDGAA